MRTWKSWVLMSLLLSSFFLKNGGQEKGGRRRRKQEQENKGEREMRARGSPREASRPLTVKTDFDFEWHVPPLKQQAQYQLSQPPLLKDPEQMDITH